MYTEWNGGAYKIITNKEIWTGLTTSKPYNYVKQPNAKLPEIQRIPVGMDNNWQKFNARSYGIKHIIDTMQLCALNSEGTPFF
jgi:hypothetical protein